MSLSPLYFTASSFVAADFETASWRRDSAVKIATVRVDGGKVTGHAESLVRYEGPFKAEHIHGISPGDVQNAAPFQLTWMRFMPWLLGAQAVFHHSTGFDVEVLRESFGREDGQHPEPQLPWLSTIDLAKAVWPDLDNYKLPTVCAHLGIPLNHHNPLSDASACAQIVLQARRQREERAA